SLAPAASPASTLPLRDALPISIPRFSGRAKAALVEIQADEYGGGVPGQSHAELFADTMVALGLDPTYGRHLDRIPAVTLATTNLDRKSTRLNSSHVKSSYAVFC